MYCATRHPPETKMRTLSISLALTFVLSACQSHPPLPEIETTTAAARPDDWWTARHEVVTDKVQEGTAQLVFIGDSITQGWESAGSNAWNQFYADRAAVNLGFSGDRTQHVLWRLRKGDLDRIAPKLTVVMIGTNNAHANEPADVAEGVRSILNELLTTWPETHILLLAIFPRGADASAALRLKNDAVNAMIAKHDGAHGLVHYLDIADAFLELDGTLSPYIMPDMLHLSEIGYDRWAKAIEAHVANYLGE